MAADGDVKVLQLACGSSHSLALLGGSAVNITASWGRGEDGQLGHGDAEERLQPQAVFSLLNRSVSSIHCGAEYCVAVSNATKEVFSWGWGDFGRLGLGDCQDVFIPTPIPALSGKAIAAVACGDTHTLVATGEGELYTFGRNQNGQLGTGNINDSLKPLLVEALQGRKVVAVACGAEHSVCSTSEGEVYAWGWGRYGNLGDGQTQDRHLPTRVRELEGTAVTGVACGWRHSAAVDAEGRLFVWGWGRYGQLGHGDHLDQLVPKQVDALSGVKVTVVAGGWRHTLASDDAGRVFAWGWNKFGQLGVGTNEDVCEPTLVEGALAGERVAVVASGWRHSLVSTEGGAVYSWGRGVNGQLGRGDLQDANTPTLLPALSVGSLSTEALQKAAHPVVMYSIPAGERYAVVPDSNADGDDDGGGLASVPDLAPKRQRI